MVLSVALPLVARGPVFRWLVRAGGGERCGTLSVGGGHVGWNAVWRMVLGRPFAMEIDEPRIIGADGSVLLAAHDLRCQMRVHRRPLAFEVTSAQIGRGNWHLSFKPGATFAEAFRPLPREGRAACLRASSAPAAGGPDRRAESVPAFAVDRLVVDDMRMDLDFVAWRLTLDHVHTAGSFTTSAQGPVTFEARHATAGSTRVRIGGEGARAMEIAFDDVLIERAAIPRDAPHDLRIDVGRASTDAAELSGHAAFIDLFDPDATKAHLDLEARWAGVAKALAKSRAPWLPSADVLGHLDGFLRVSIHAPMADLRGTAELDVKTARLVLTADREKATADLAIGAYDTTWLLEPSLRSALGGALSGHVVATADWAGGLSAVAASVRKANLVLRRRATAVGPERVRVSIGDGRGQDESDESGEDDDLVLHLDRARLVGHTVHLERIRLRTAGARLDGAATFTVAAPTRLDADATLEIPSIAALFPQSVVAGALVATAALSGTAANIGIDLGFAPSTSIRLAGQRVRLPNAVHAVWLPGENLALAPLRLGLGQGDVTLAGRLHQGGRVRGSLAVHHLPLAPLATFHPYGMDLTHGTLDGHASFWGSWRHLLARGSVEAAGMGLGGWRPIAVSGTMSLRMRRSRPESASAALRVEAPGVANGEVTVLLVEEHASARARADLDLPALRPLWSPGVHAMNGRVHAEAAWNAQVAEASPAHVAGQLRAVGTITVQLLPHGAPVAIASGAVLDLQDDILRVPEWRLGWQGIEATLAGELHPMPSAWRSSPVQLRLTATLDADRTPLRLPWLILDRGTATLSAEMDGSLAAPRFQAQLSLQDLGAQGGALPATRLNGEITVLGNVARTEALTLDIARIGRVRLGGEGESARVQLDSLVPFRVGEADVPIHAEHLDLDRPGLPLRLPVVRAQGRFAGHAQTGFTLSGVVDFDDASYDVRRSFRSGKPGGAPWFRSLPKNLTLDLTLRATRSGLRVDLPILPDLTLDVQCRLLATHDEARLVGRIRGESIYARTAVRLYQWFSDRDVDRCRLLQP